MKTPIKKIVTKGSTASVPYSQYIGSPEDITIDHFRKSINFHDGVTTGGISLLQKPNVFCGFQQSLTQAMTANNLGGRANYRLCVWFKCDCHRTKSNSYNELTAVGDVF